MIPNNQVKVSIVLCTYNGKKYLAEQLDSLLAQTYPIHELIIQDDQSSDGTIDILRKYQQQYPVIRLNLNQQNLGYNANFSSALQKATGDFIAIADQDDIWLPEKIEVLLENIDDNLLIFSQSELFDMDNPGWKLIDYPNQPIVSIEEIAFGNRISGHAALFRKELLDKVPFWDERYYYDWWLAIVAACFDSIKFIDKPLILWRRHMDSITHKLYIKEFSLSKRLRIRDFLRRRKAYMHSLYQLLDKIDSNGRQDEIKKIVRKTRNNNPFLTFISCLNCLKYKRIYYPKDSKITLKMYYKSFMRPIDCRGF